MPNSNYGIKNDLAPVLSQHRLTPYHCRAIDCLLKNQITYAIGGGFTASFYSGREWTEKTIEVYVLPENWEQTVAALTAHGFRDAFSDFEYDRTTQFHSQSDGQGIEIRWQLGNKRGEVRTSWLKRSQKIQKNGRQFFLLPPEELIWTKLHMLRKDRCDWPDLLNILYLHASALNWRRLVDLTSGDGRLLAGLLCVFNWMCPTESQHVPHWVWKRLTLAQVALEEIPVEERSPRFTFLDGRSWFGPSLPRKEPRLLSA